MRTQCVKKEIFFITILLLVLLIFFKKSNDEVGSRYNFIRSKTQFIEDWPRVSGERIKQSDLKYILQWTSRHRIPFVYMGKGRKGFIARRCPYTNCIVTSNRSFFSDYSKFDVVAFAGPEISRAYNLNKLPTKRSLHQKYVFASIESPIYYPVCVSKFDGYFNWTWTFKLDSEVQWGYMTVRDSNNSVVGPNKHMNWMKLEDMDPISEEFKNQLRTKTRAAVWFVSNCHTRSRREKYVLALQEELNRYNLAIDVYGNCGSLKCSKKEQNKCYKIIKEKYYFYLSFENAFSEDYVTEKLLHALENDAIPVVYGGANYTRFMPDGIYLNARELGVEKLAEMMNDLINDIDKYSEYFKWKKYYSYYKKSASVETDPYCLFCQILNDAKMVEETTVYEDFINWWNPLKCII
ncbi:alpha-(1,3)-fucosyltransferase C-like [Anticarsia gemmatalis]|uniref:alpha-(1,3)-fucosyltransferase C-like n=1 Tax=Anticarsia gemmatalis TaxID=129554 RepID=UPI003F76D835